MDLFASHTVSIIGITLVHFLWQGTLAGLGTAALLAACPQEAASARYRIAGGGLLLMVVAPVVTLAAIGWASPAVAGPGTWYRLAETTQAGTGGPTPAFAFASMASYLPVAVAAWATGVVLLTARLVFAWWRTEQVRRIDVRPATEGLTAAVARLAGHLRLRRSVRLFESPWVDAPTVIGWLRPTILLPIGALTGLSVQQVEAVLMHELAHIRRHDYLVNALQNLAETVFFFHPAVWWVSKQIRIEREHCCDDVAVRACGNPVGYARALTVLEERRQRQAAFALAATDGSLVHRVRRLLGASPARTSRPTLSIALCVAVILGLLATGAAQTPSQSTAGAAAVLPTRALPESQTTFVDAPGAGMPIGTSLERAVQGPAGPPPGFEPGVVTPEAAVGPVRDQPVPPAEPLRVGGDIKEPRKILNVPPVYPAAAQQAGVSGVVILEAVIDPEGSVSSIRILRSIPDLDQAAINAVRQWRYTPSLLNGVPVPVVMTVTVNFTLRETPERLETRYEDLGRQMEEAREHGDDGRYRTLQLERLLVEQRLAAERKVASSDAQAPEVTPQNSARDDDGIPRVGGTITEPKKVHSVPPVYPAAALAARVSGVVIIEAVIDEHGNVTEPRILRSIPMLDDAAIDAVMQWKYAPSRVGDVPTPVRMTMTVNFAPR